MDGSQYLDSVDFEGAFNLTGTLDFSLAPRLRRKDGDRATPPASSSFSSVHFSSSPGKVSAKNDRFIPNREAMNFEVGHYQVLRDALNSGESTPSPSGGGSDVFKSTLADNLSVSGVERSEDSVVLAFKGRPPEPKPFYHPMRTVYTESRIKENLPPPSREIPSHPERVLDAPDIVDDYYLNLLDWSSGNLLSVALGPTVYLWNAANGSIQELLTLRNPGESVCSVSFLKQGGGVLAVGTSSNEIQLWDVMSQRQLRSMSGHQARVSCLDWSNYVLASGSRDAQILLHDVRVQNSVLSNLSCHTQEVCQLKWSPDQSYLASGSNDNSLVLWSASQSNPVSVHRDHTAAVKGLSWCPYQHNILASGGGTADRTIKIWNAHNGSMLSSSDTGSQVCSLLWNPLDRELLSSHGFSQNQLSLWSYPSMTKIKDLTGHTARVLHMVLSPDGQTVCSASADETLRFWKVFASSGSSARRSMSAKPRSMASTAVFLR